MRLYPNVTVIFIIWLVAILSVALLSFNLLPHSPRFENDFLKSFSNWDGGHYLGIAQFSYSEKFQYAFFPLYPIFIRGVNYLLQNYLFSAFLISIISSFFALHLLYKLVSIEYDKKIAEKAISAIIFFPTSFFFLTAYTEGLFFFLIVATFYFLRKQRLFLATIFAIFASATKVTGLALVLTLLIETQMLYGINRKNWYVLLSPLGFILYCIFLYNQTGDPFYFLISERHWLRSIALPVIPFWEAIRNLSTPGFINTNFTTLLDLIFATFGVGFIIRSFRFLPPSYSIYSLVSLAIPLFTPTLVSIPRFLLVIFPIFILIALIKNKYVILTYQIISLMLLSLFVGLFINGYWVS